MLPFVILPRVWGPLSFEFTVERLFMCNQKLIDLLILWLGDPSILVEVLLHFEWAPCPLITQKAVYASSFQFGFISSG